MVGEQVKNRNVAEVLRAIRDHFDPHYDFLLLPNVPLDTLDFTSYTMNLGSKMILDATPKLASSSSGGKYPTRRENEYFSRTGRASGNPSDIDMRIREYRLIEDTLLVVKVEGAYTSKENAAKNLEGEISPSLTTTGREVIERLITQENIEYLPKGTKIVAAVSEDINLSNVQEVIWGIFTRFDAARDVLFTKMELNGIAPIYQGIMGIDATWKVGYPNPCIMTDEIVTKVSNRWKEYGF
jgi:4-hydroxy-3-polyprenylbenzoate decarboxylase